MRLSSWGNRATSQDPTTLADVGLSLLIMVLALPLFFLSSGSQTLNGCDESYYAQMSREMVTTGEWLAPRFLGELFFEKPPLLQWLVALCFKLGGVNEWMARLPGILCALGSIPVIGWIGRQFVSRQAAALGMAILPLSFLWIEQGRLVGQDIPLTFLELVGVAALIAGMYASPQWFWLMGVALGLGLLMKSVMVLLLVIAVVPYLLVVQRTPRVNWLGSGLFWLGMGLGLGIFGLWLGSATLVYGASVFESLLGKVGQLGAAPFHASNNWLYYFWHIPLNGFPWTVLALVGGVILLQERPGKTVLLWSLPLVMFLQLLIYPTRTHYYTVQLYPWLALLAGVTIDRATERWGDRALIMSGWPHLASVISSILAGVGGILIAVAGSVVAGVEVLQILRPHVWGLVAIGVLDLALLGIWQGRRILRHGPALWIATLMTASVIVQISVILRPDFGNFNPQLATFVRQSWPLPPGSRVDIGWSGLPDVCQAQAHAFYTPLPGKRVTDPQLQSGQHGAYVWVSPEQVKALGAGLDPLQRVAELEGWQLMQAKGS